MGVMRRLIHHSAHLGAALLLLAASVLTVLPATAAVGPAMDSGCGSACPMMMAARGADARDGSARTTPGLSCERPDGSGVSCCDSPDERPATPLEQAVPTASPTLVAPMAAVRPMTAPVSGAGALRADDLPFPGPPGPDLFLLHASFLS